MTTSVTRQVIAAISKGPCAAVLRPAGFRRSSPHFWRDGGGINHAINFQASQWNAGRSGQFTINLGVSTPALYQAFTGRTFPKNRGTTLWPIFMRLGQFIHGTDRWWEVNSAADAHVVGEEIATALTEHALPFFSRIATTDDLARWVQEPYPGGGVFPAQKRLVLAGLAAGKGHLDEARSLLSPVLLENRGKPFEMTTRQFAKRLGIELDEAVDGA